MNLTEKAKIMRVAPVAVLIIAAIGGIFLLMSSDGSDEVDGESTKRIVAVPQNLEVDYFEPPKEELKYESKVEDKRELNKSNPASSEVFSAPKYIPPPSGISPTAPIPPTSSAEPRTSFLSLILRFFGELFK